MLPWRKNSLQRALRVGKCLTHLATAPKPHSQLAVDVGKPMVDEALKGEVTFVMSETIYALAGTGRKAPASRKLP